MIDEYPARVDPFSIKKSTPAACRLGGAYAIENNGEGALTVSLKHQQNGTQEAERGAKDTVL